MEKENRVSPLLLSPYTCSLYLCLYLFSQNDHHDRGDGLCSDSFQFYEPVVFMRSTSREQFSQPDSDQILQDTIGFCQIQMVDDKH
jgi:hypothetical protein